MTADRKRPWYLVAALLGALALGTSGASSGWGRMELYRESVDLSSEGDGISDPAEREAIVARARAWLQALDNAKSRGWPLGVATMLLGSAVFVFAMRTLGGSSSARAALVQLVVAQAGLHVADYWLLRNVWDMNGRLLCARETAIAREHGAPPFPCEETLGKVGFFIALETLGSALVVVGLTRRRSRQFLDATAEALGGP